MSENLSFHHGQMSFEEFCFICLIAFRLFTTRWKRGQKCMEQLVKDFLSAFSKNKELLFVVNTMHRNTSICLANSADGF